MQRRLIEPMAAAAIAAARPWCGLVRRSLYSPRVPSPRGSEVAAPRYTMPMKM
jgi:hypothetical protein